MKFKKSMICVLGVATLAMPIFAACGNTSSVTNVSSEKPATSSEQTSNATSEEVSSEASSSELNPALKDHVTLNLSVFYNSTKTAMKFTNDSPCLGKDLADGTVITAGEFKPVWKAVQKNLNFTINDVTDTSQTSIQKKFQVEQSAGFKKNGELINVSQGNSSDIMAEGTQNGTILDLSKYLNKMPNFSKFLSDNPIVAKQIVDSSGAMYYAPYFDGFDDLERTLLMRKGWVEKLLDGDYVEATYNTDVKIDSKYSRFNAAAVDQDVTYYDAATKAKATGHKKYTSGNDVITLQNALANKTGAALVKTLRDYIDATYKKADGTSLYGDKRSELFLSGKACYNIDELVALYRCVKANGTLLSGQSDKAVIPLIPRQFTNDRTAMLRMFMLYFGCRGFAAPLTNFYVNDKGVLSDVRDSDEVKVALQKMHEMYQEGLILQDFTSKTADGATDGNYSTNLMQKSDIAFSEYDYVQTQTIMNAKNANLQLVPVVPASYAWDGKAESKYTDSWRGVKPQGWFITKETANDEAKLNRALYLFDYFYGEEGNRLMSYGPDAWVDGTTTYMGKQVPKLSDACLNELKTYMSGNYTNYYRQILGGTFPVGYVKEQGMEYQTVDATARTYLDEIETALSLNVIKHPDAKVGHTDHMLDQMPATVSLTSGEQQTIKDSYSNLTTYFDDSKTGTHIFTTIVQKGFEGADKNYTDAAGFTKYIRETLNIQGYDKIIADAYARMGL